MRTDRGAGISTVVGASGTAKSAPVLEVRPATRNVDVDRAGEHLVVHRDRVELRDRTDATLTQVPVAEITQVAIRRRLGTVTLVVEGGDGDRIVLRGVHPDQAERVRALLQDDQPAAPLTAAGRSIPDRALSPSHAEVLRTLEWLHDLGVLTERELNAKRAHVARVGVGPLNQAR
jgi:hypothetical protein